MIEDIEAQNRRFTPQISGEPLPASPRMPQLGSTGVTGDIGLAIAD
jgi:hypothetical protein